MLLARVFPNVAHVSASVLTVLTKILAIGLQLLGVLLGFRLVASLEIRLHLFAVGEDFLAIRANLTSVGTNFLAIRDRLWVVPAPCDELCPRYVRGCFQRGLGGLCRGV